MKGKLVQPTQESIAASYFSGGPGRGRGGSARPYKLYKAGLLPCVAVGNTSMSLWPLSLDSLVTIVAQRRGRKQVELKLFTSERRIYRRSSP